MSDYSASLNFMKVRGQRSLDQITLKKNQVWREGRNHEFSFNILSSKCFSDINPDILEGNMGLDLLQWHICESSTYWW